MIAGLYLRFRTWRALRSFRERNVASRHGRIREWTSNDYDDLPWMLREAADWIEKHNLMLDGIQVGSDDRVIWLVIVYREA